MGNLAKRLGKGLEGRLPVRVLGVLLLGCGLLAGSARAQEGEGPFAPGAGRMVRGTVTAVAPDHLTVKSDAGETFQVAVTPNTQVRKGRDLVKFSDVHAGDGVGAMGEIDAPNKTVHALYLFLVDAEQLKKAREAMGKTYIAGKVTAIDELKLTVQRVDGVAQTIAVDEDTSFKRGGRGMSAMMSGTGIGPGTAGGGPGAAGSRPGGGGGGPEGGESITLADVKVGDSVAGPGALKSGIFVPTQLYVGDPAARGNRRRGAGSQAPGTQGAGTQGAGTQGASTQGTGPKQ